MRAKGANSGWVSVPWLNFAIHADFPHPAGNELGVLGAEIQNQDAVEMNIAGGHGGTLKVN